MSRVGKLPITIPKGVTARLQDQVLTVKGPRGTLARRVSDQLDFQFEGETLRVLRRDESKESRSLHGLMRALIFNMVHGVSQGFNLSLEILGTGYKVESQANVLNLNLGYSHPIRFPLPQGVTAAVEKGNIVKLDGFDREVLGQTAARIRALRPAEPYKGKGIRYVGETILRKAGKTGGKKK